VPATVKSVQMFRRRRQAAEVSSVVRIPNGGEEDAAVAEVGSNEIGPVLKRLERTTFWRAECHLTAARFYSYLHTAAGMLAAGLAAASGGTAFAGETIIAGIAGITSAVTAGFLTIFKPDERTQSHWHAARSYSALSDEIAVYSRFQHLRVTKGVETESPREGRSQPDQKQGDSRVAALDSYSRRCAELEADTFPVPSRIAKVARRHFARRDEWYPPQDKDFDAWWNRRVTYGRRGWWPFDRTSREAENSSSVPDDQESGRLGSNWGRGSGA
jgi:hypothetical protein